MADLESWDGFKSWRDLGRSHWRQNAFPSFPNLRVPWENFPRNLRTSSQTFALRPHMPPTTRCTGGYQNLKITDFELGDRSRVVRWVSYLVGMQYPWVLQVGKRSDSSDNSTMPKISILGRRWNQSVKWPITTPELKIKILSSPGTLECSNHPQTVSTCGTR